MIVLVPAHVYEELVPLAREAAPAAELVPYAEEDDGGAAPGGGRAEAVFRWVAGKRYAALATELGPDVRWLHTASAGVDHVLTPPVLAKAQRGELTVTDSGPAFAISIGEFVVAWMLMVAHRMPDILEQQRTKTWKWLNQEELHGQTVGIVGLGPIGVGIAERCRALGMRTLGLRRRPEPVAAVDETLTGPDGLARLLAESDWVVLAAALTGETRSLIGPAELARMKPTARLVNIARGAMVDEAALIDALTSGRLAGACLDVFAKEPLPEDSPLWTLPNVYVAPHNSSGWTAGLKERQKRLFVENLSRFAAGEPLSGVVDITRGY
jgi:phosphoglycerate dehydrogenase-like enzyme